MPRLALLTLLLASVVLPAAAQNARSGAAEARFHDGARLYAAGDVAAARSVVDAALAETPADARLRALRELLREDDPSGGGASPPPDEPERSGGSDDAPPPPDAPPDDRSPEGSGATPPPGGSEGAPPPPEAGRGPMSRAEAEALVDAVGGTERLLPRQQRLGAGARPDRRERDW